MGGESNYPIEKFKDGNKLHQETGTKNIQRKSAKEIKENFNLLTEEFLQHSFEYLVQQNSALKNIFNISKLKDLKIIKISNAEKGKLHLNLSTKSMDDFNYILSRNWVSKSGIRPHKDWVTIHLYWSSLILNIRQEKLSS